MGQGGLNWALKMMGVDEKWQESKSSVVRLVCKGIRDSDYRNWRWNLMPEKSRVSYVMLKITRHILKREMKII